MNKFETGIVKLSKGLIQFSIENEFLSKVFSPRSRVRIHLHNLVLFRKYRPWGKSVSPMIVYMIDGSFDHMGLADRIRQIMGVYAMSKHKGYKFGLIHSYPFELSNYLLPKYNWEMTEDNFSKNMFIACSRNPALTFCNTATLAPITQPPVRDTPAPTTTTTQAPTTLE